MKEGGGFALSRETNHRIPFLSKKLSRYGLPCVPWSNAKGRLYALWQLTPLANVKCTPTLTFANRIVRPSKILLSYFATVLERIWTLAHKSSQTLAWTGIQTHKICTFTLCTRRGLLRDIWLTGARTTKGALHSLSALSLHWQKQRTCLLSLYGRGGGLYQQHRWNSHLLIARSSLLV